MSSTAIARARTAIVVAAALTGCSSGGKPIPIPKISPAKSAAAAIQAYDADGDARLSESELAACPGMLAAVKLYDQDGDGHVSQQEIEDRLDTWREAKMALTSLSCSVTLDGRALPGAQVKLVPEPYLGDKITAATGTTSRRGSTVVSVPKATLPEHAQNFRGVNYGTYRVEITHPSVSLPERYQAPSTLGHEVAPDFGIPYAAFNLKSR